MVEETQTPKLRNLLIQRDIQEYKPIKPIDELRKELRIKASLLAQGVDREIADAVVGYRPKDIPFIYGTDVHFELHHQNHPTHYELVPGEGCLWIGTTDSIGNLVCDNPDLDRTPEVIVQWWGDKIGSSPNTSRTEIKHLSDGRFLKVKYSGVSQVGQFDGTIEEIRLYSPLGKRANGKVEMQQIYFYKYPHSQFHRYQRSILNESFPGSQSLVPAASMDSTEWTVSLEDLSRFNRKKSGAAPSNDINGLSQLVDFHMGHIFAAKADYGAAYRILSIYPQILESQSESSRVVGTTSPIYTRAQEISRKLAPIVGDFLAEGEYGNEGPGPETLGRLREVADMMTEGIFNHSHYMHLFDKPLAIATPNQRFDLAQLVHVLSMNGMFKSWVSQLMQGELGNMMEDVVNRNADHLVRTYIKGNPTRERINKAMDLLEEKVDEIVETGRTHQDRQAEQMIRGMTTSYFERFIEYLFQRTDGHSLT